MSRYFYLLCFLLAINWTICYDYISDRNSQNKHGRRLSKKVRGQKSRQCDKENVHKKGQEYKIIEDKDPIAQIDVASFIQKPDEYAVDEKMPIEMDNKRRKTQLNNENDYGSLLEYNPDEYIMKRSNKRPYYLNPSPDSSFDLGPNPLLLKETINSRHLNLDSLSLHGLNNGKVTRNFKNKPTFTNYNGGLDDTNTNIFHSPEKKSVLKYMRFPFFSHNKTETPKPKKEKKRKVFCFNCSKKENKPNESSGSDYFKENAKKESLETLNEITMNSPSDDFDNLVTKTLRGKREDWSNVEDRQRQLKELEEIQRKVDSVEISPTYQKLP